MLFLCPQKEIHLLRSLCTKREVTEDEISACKPKRRREMRHYFTLLYITFHSLPLHPITLHNFSLTSLTFNYRPLVPIILSINIHSFDYVTLPSITFHYFLSTLRHCLPFIYTPLPQPSFPYLLNDFGLSDSDIFDKY